MFSITKDPHTKLEQLTILNSFAWYGIQLHFTNGFKSPLFMTSFKEDRQTATHRIDTLRNIRKIAVKDWKPQICGLKMMDGKGKDLLNLEWCALGQWQTQDIAEDEEIVGVYGNKTQSDYFNNIGFIVLKR